MKMLWQRSTLLTVLLLLIGSAVAVAARPRTVSPQMLGAEWWCTRMAFVLTTCSHTAGTTAPTRAEDRTVGSQNAGRSSLASIRSVR
jgi:hypothetical protein